MAVTDIDVIKADGGYDSAQEREFTVTYRVFTNSRSDGPITALNAAGIPIHQQPYVYGNDADYGAYCVGKRATLQSVDESMKIWLVDCQFSSKGQSRNSENNDTTDPLDVPVRWSGGHQQWQIPAREDKDGTRIKNTAGDDYDPLPMMDQSRPVITCVKNQRSLDINTYAEYVDSVNSSTFWGVAARGLKCQAITWNQQWRGDGLPYYQVTYEFSLGTNAQGTWDFRLISAGYNELDSGTLKRIQVTTEGGEKVPITEPWPLNSSGAALTEAQIDSDSEYTQTFRVYKEKDFSVLDLPSRIGDPR